MSSGRAPAGNAKAAALSVVNAIAERWDIPKAARCGLLGVPKSTANHWFAALDRGEIKSRESLRGSVMERVAHIATIYDLCHRIVKGDDADDWMQRSNAAFGGRKPITLVLNGRADDLIRVRWYLEGVASR